VCLALVHRFVRPLTWAAALIVIALPFGITGKALLTGGVYGPIDYPNASEPLRALKPLYGIGPAPHNASATDVYSQFFPWRRAVQASLQRGEWPLWNPYMLSGHLLAGGMQSAPYSPFTLIACLLPAAVSFTFTTSIALFLAALGAYLLARELGCVDFASLVAAAGWAYAASTILYIHTAMGFTNAYEPLLLLGAMRVARKPGVASAIFLAIVLTLMIVAGHPETLFLAVLAGVALGIFEMVRARRKPWRAIGFAIAGGVLALLLCAIQLLPFYEGLLQSAELEVKKHWALDARAMTNDRVLAVLATDVFPHLHVRQWLHPSFGLTQAETAACGSIILALAVYALWRRRSTETAFFGVMALLGIVIESGWKPVVLLLQKIPLVNITHLERFAFTAALSLCVLAALGVDELLRRNDHRVAAITLASVLLVLAAGTWWITHHVVLAITWSDWGDFKIFAELACLGIAALLLALRAPMRVVAPALLVLLVAQRVMSEGGTFQTFPAEAAYPPVAIFDALKNVREPFRIVGSSFALLPDTSAFYGLEDVRGYEAMHYAPFVETWGMWCSYQPLWFTRVDDINAPFLTLMNARYAVVADSAPMPEGWKRVAQQRGAALLENPRALDRLFVPNQVTVGLPFDTQIVLMSKQKDFADMAWLTADVKPYARANGPGRITLRAHSPGGRYHFDADMGGDGWVVLSENAWKGWRAYVDNKRVVMQTADATFLSVYVPKGHHDVRIVYWPDSFVRGRAITFATLIVLIGVGVWTAVTRVTALPRRTE
jgi:hypothetical protein